MMKKFSKKPVTPTNSSQKKKADSPGPLFNDSLHANEKDQFLQLVAQTGDSFSDDQVKIMDIFLKINGHLSAEYIHNELSHTGKKIKLSLIYKTLEMFYRYGFAQKHVFNASGTLYEHLHIGVHHDHLLCPKCGRVEEFYNPELEALQQSVVNQHEFTSLHHHLIIQGLCPACMENRNAPRPLTESISGERLKIVGFGSSRQTTARLRAMGLINNDIIEVINNGDPIIISRSQSRLALASDLAKHIIVSTVTN